MIRSQEEFEAMVASSTWLGAHSVLFVGDGGARRFTRSDGLGIKVPDTVYRLQGINVATIEVLDFVYSDSNRGPLWYNPGITNGNDNYRIDDLTIHLTTSEASFGVAYCNNLTRVRIFTHRTDQVNNVNQYGFHTCENLNQCKCQFDWVPLTTLSVMPMAEMWSSYWTGYVLCNNLMNCMVSLIDDADGRHSASNGYDSCVNLRGCSGTVKNADRFDSGFFYRCKVLSGCNAILGNLGYSRGSGFGLCEQLSECNAYIGSSDKLIESKAFDRCVQLSDCSGKGFSSSTVGMCYGFYDCSYLNGCRKYVDTNNVGVGTAAFLGGTNTKVDADTVVDK